MKILLRLLAGLFLSGSFLLAGVLKVRAPDRFLLDVESFALLPAWLAYATALVLPWLEIFAALALWSGRLARGALLILGSLAAAFMIGLILAEARGLELDCGCFGDWLQFPNLATHLVYNGLLLAASVGLGWGTRRKKAA